MKKNFSLTTLAFLLMSCTLLKALPETALWATTKAKSYSKEAQISYFKCSYEWPKGDCVQHNWDLYGEPVIERISQEDWKNKALVFIETMEKLGAAIVLRDNGYKCDEISYLGTPIFEKDKKAVCDNGFEYTIEPQNNSWHIELVKSPNNEGIIKKHGRGHYIM